MADNVRSKGRPIAGERIAIGAVVLLMVVSGFAGSQYTQRLRVHTNLVKESYLLLNKLDNLESTLQLAESGQQGFIITGQESYLDSFQSARKSVESFLSDLSASGNVDSTERSKIIALKPIVEQKMIELDSTNDVRQRDGFEAAQKMVTDGIGLKSMDAVHNIIEEIRNLERQSMAKREIDAATTYWTALVVGLLSTIAGLALVVSVLYLVQSNRHRAERAAETISAERERLQASLDRIRRLEIDNKRMDQYMRSFVEQVEDYAIFAMDEDCRATTWNNGVLKVLGFQESEFIGQDIRQLIFVPEAIELGIPVAEFEAAASLGSASDDRWMMRKGGHRFWASGITSAVKDDRGNLVGFSKVMRDLTERKRDEDELAELAARHSESNRRMNEFMATLAHELRNPLAPIRNAIDLMGMTNLTPEHEELRALMGRQVQQVIRLIDDLLDVSRIGRGKIVLQRSIVDLRAIIESSIEAFNAVILEKQQHLQCDVCKTEVRVYVDPARLTQVVSNLLNNASRYSDDGSHIRLELKMEKEDDDHGYAIMVVKDDGIGISTDRLDEIFQMFAQVDDSLGRGNAGLGIGLTLVKTLVELHKGTVVAQSDGIGHGSTFTVRIPLAVADADTVAEEPITEWPICARTFNVLVVEDMRALRTIMARLLEKLGHRVQVAEDGLAALEALTRFNADIIFSDISMPGMTGYDLARKIRDQPSQSEIYLVAMSGYGQLSDRMQSRASGFDEHMIKPVDITKLRELFERLSRERPLP